MVVSNLRHFNLKIGVYDPRIGVGRDAELPLKAELLYENGQLVEQLATCEPLLVGKTEVVAMQGTALFKLRITSLSSHRDKQRFRIRISPVDTSLLLREPGLSVVTTPMKCVTKLSHRSSGGGARVLAGLMNLRGSNERKNNIESKDKAPSLETKSRSMAYPRPTKRRRRRSSTDMTKKQINELRSLCAFLKRQSPQRVNLLQAAMTPFKVFCHSPNFF